MAIICIEKRDFSLDRNSSFSESLRNVGVSPTEYVKELQPFFESLTGFYFAKGHSIKRWGFPQMKYEISGLNVTQLLSYVRRETDLIKVPIQNLESFRIDMRKRAPINPDDKPFIQRGLAIQSYSRQNGTIDVSRIDETEVRVAQLEGIVHESQWVPTGKLSNRALSHWMYAY